MRIYLAVGLFWLFGFIAGWEWSRLKYERVRHILVPMNCKQSQWL